MGQGTKVFWFLELRVAVQLVMVCPEKMLSTEKKTDKPKYLQGSHDMVVN